MLSHGNEAQTTLTTNQRITQAGLPHLTGSAEEIARAEPIRLNLLVAADDALTLFRSDEILTGEQADTATHPSQTVSPQDVKAAETALRTLRHQTEAAWWIEHAQADIRQLLVERGGPPSLLQVGQRLAP